MTKQRSRTDTAPSRAASSHGLPDRIDRTWVHVVLVISPVFATCQQLATSFEGAIPDQLTVVVTASDPVRMRKWASVHGLPLDAVVFDDDMSIVNGLGVSSSPAAVGFFRGEATFGANLGGHRACVGSRGGCGWVQVSGLARVSQWVQSDWPAVFAARMEK